MAYDAAPPAEVTTRDRMIRLRDRLTRVDPEKFHMAHVVHSCGSPSCILGYFRDEFKVGFDAPAAKLLGLSPQQAADLFRMSRTYTEEWVMPNIAWPFNVYSATPADAVKVLDHFLLTGEIDWSVAR